MTKHLAGSTVVISLGTPTAYASAGAAYSLRVATDAGRTTTVHVAKHEVESTSVELALVDPRQPLQEWASSRQIREALSGGFFTKPELLPLGELAVAGKPGAHRPFVEPWAAVRGTLCVRDGRIAIGRRDEFELGAFDALLQAGPLLVQGGRPVVGDDDPEGFSSTCEEFDSDITDGPYPRVAVGVSPRWIVAVSADGRSEEDDGLTLVELAHLLVELGAEAALNLDGGASSSLIAGGSRRNRPRDDEGTLLEDGYPNATALVFHGSRGPAG